MANKVITCGFCESKGHNKTACPDRIRMGIECESIDQENASKLIGELRFIIEDGGNIKLPKLPKWISLQVITCPPRELCISNYMAKQSATKDIAYYAVALRGGVTLFV